MNLNLPFDLHFSAKKLAYVNYFTCPKISRFKPLCTLSDMLILKP